MTPDEEAESVRRIVAQLNQAEPIAFATQDYWTFDGYLRIQKQVAAQDLRLDKALFPGIELRVAAPTNFRLNFHVVLSDEVPPDRLEGFIQTLRLVDLDAAPTKSCLIRLGRDAPEDIWKTYGDPKRRGEELADYELGWKIAEVSIDSVRAALKPFERSEYVVVQPYDTYGGLQKLDWKKYPLKNGELSKLADFFEAKDPTAIASFHGVETADNSEWLESWLNALGGYPKPVLRGSDAHKVGDYGAFPNGKRTWIKGRPVFATLHHVMADPRARNWIGNEHPHVQRVNDAPRKTIAKLTIEQIDPHDTEWFKGALPFNSGLVAIIGNKGSGKSALADCLALAGNAHADSYSFLTDDRFRTDGARAAAYEARLEWRDGDSTAARLSQVPDATKPQRVRYLPQRFVEEICNSIDDHAGSKFEQQLRSVIFGHLEPETRREAESLEEVMTRLATPHRQRASALRERLTAANAEVVQLLRRLSAERMQQLREGLGALEEELRNHKESAPSVVEAPDSGDPAREKSAGKLEELRQKLSETVRNRVEAEAERRDALERLSKVEKVAGSLRELERRVREARESLAEDASALGVDLAALVELSVEWGPIHALESDATGRVDELSGKLSEDAEGAFHALEAQLKVEIASIQAALNGEDEAYERYLAASSEHLREEQRLVGDEHTPGSIKWYNAEFAEMESEAPERLATAEAARDGIARQIHAEVRATQTAWKRLFQPVQEYLHAQVEADGQEFEFEVALSSDGLAGELFGLVAHNRGGRFRGKNEGRDELKKLVRGRDWEAEDDALATAQAIWDALTGSEPSGALSSAEGQLRPGGSAQKVLDVLFGFEYLEPFYTLTRAKVPLRKLSPGERGAVLLIFYLLVDREDIPLVVDQPEHNLDNETVFQMLVPCFRKARERRQVILVTHNPNLAVACDADQVIRATFDREKMEIRYQAGGLEDAEVERWVVDVLEGTAPAFRRRRGRYLSSQGLT